MPEEELFADASESGTPVADEIFNDDTPIDETFEDEDSGEEVETPDEDETTEAPSADEDEEITPSSFTDLDAANKHIAKLNRENARRRTESKEYDQVFSKFDDESKPLVLNLIDTLATDPEAGAKQLLQVAKNILGEDALAPQNEIDENKPLTLKEWREMQARDEQERQARAKEEADVQAIFTKAEELGYKAGTPERQIVLALAAAGEKQGGTNGNLDKAHEAFENLIQARIQQYIDGKSNQKDSFPTTGEGGQPGTQGKTPSNWNDFIDQSIEYANSRDNVGK